VTSAELPAVEPGAVLVVYHAAPTWGGLLHQAAGVVSELDTPLSAPAQLCRALGVPMVCCVPGVTRSIRSGDPLRIDGARGSVERLAP
jgi:pyruvate,water dikinase